MVADTISVHYGGKPDSYRDINTDTNARHNRERSKAYFEDWERSSEK